MFCKIICILAMGFFLLSCSTSNDNSSALRHATEEVQKYTIQKDRTSVTGQLVDDNNVPISNIPIRLAEVYRQNGQASFVLDTSNSPASQTNSQGIFAFTSIPAREYVVVVGDIEGRYTILLDDNLITRIINPLPNNVLDIGQTKVVFNN